MVTFTTILFLLVFNLLAWICIHFFGRLDHSKLPSYINTQAYLSPQSPLKTDSACIFRVVRDFRSVYENSQRGFRYQPVVEYTHVPIRSKHLNIIYPTYDFPRRITVPENFSNVDSVITIYCFGGSTTFGWLVSDEHTWPSLLMKNFSQQDKKNIIVKNYGAVGYSPSQETELFLQLLKMGHRPSLCIFMDGYNTGPVWDGSDLSQTISNKYRIQESFNPMQFFYQMPLTQLAFHLLYSGSGSYSDSLLFPLEHSNRYNQTMINRFKENDELRQSISLLYGIPIIQFLQPSIFVAPENYPYRKEYRKFYKNMEGEKNYKAIYQAIINAGTGYINLSACMNSYSGMPFIDWCHYSPNFNQHLADTIMRFIDPGKLQAGYFDSTLATGITFNH